MKHRELHAKRGKRAGKAKESLVPAPPVNMAGSFKRLMRPYKPSWQKAPPPPPPGGAPIPVQSIPSPPPPGGLRPYKRHAMGLRAPGQIRRMRVARFGVDGVPPGYREEQGDRLQRPPPPPPQRGTGTTLTVDQAQASRAPVGTESQNESKNDVMSSFREKLTAAQRGPLAVSSLPEGAGGGAATGAAQRAGPGPGALKTSAARITAFRDQFASPRAPADSGRASNQPAPPPRGLPGQFASSREAAKGNVAGQFASSRQPAKRAGQEAAPPPPRQPPPPQPRPSGEFAPCAQGTFASSRPSAAIGPGRNNALLKHQAMPTLRPGPPPPTRGAPPQAPPGKGFVRRKAFDRSTAGAMDLSSLEKMIMENPALGMDLVSQKGRETMRSKAARSHLTLQTKVGKSKHPRPSQGDGAQDSGNRPSAPHAGSVGS